LVLFIIRISVFTDTVNLLEFTVIFLTTHFMPRKTHQQVRNMQQK